MKINKKKLVYLISPNKISSNFYKNLNMILSTGKVSFFQMRLKKYSFKDKIMDLINPSFLKAKLVLVSILIIVAVISIPIISLPGNDFMGFNLKFFKHALEWDYFIGVITFYLFTFFMWKKINL